jgi:hypothetical protein
MSSIYVCAFIFLYLNTKIKWLIHRYMKTSGPTSGPTGGYVKLRIYLHFCSQENRQLLNFCINTQITDSFSTLLLKIFRVGKSATNLQVENKVALQLKISVFSDMTPCKLVKSYQLLRLIVVPCKRRQQASPKCRYLFTNVLIN